MAARYLLYFTGEGHCLYRSSRGGLDLEAKFSGDDIGIGEFRAFLQGRSRALFSIVADVAGEDFHEEQVPLLRGSDREAVLQRRLAQRYRDTRLAAALSLGHVVGGERRNERLLLASFTNTQTMAPWLDALEEAGACLAGVYSVPLLAPALAARLGAPSGRAFIVSAHRAGLRQCFVEDGRLRFARLERTVEMAPHALAGFVRSETLRLAQYLATLRVLPREGAPVRVLVVAPPGQRTAFEGALHSDTRLLFRTLDWTEATRAAGLGRFPEGSRAETLYLHLAGRRAPREQFASSAERRRYFMWQVRRGVVAAGALSLAACTLYAGARFLDAAQIRESARLQLEQAQLAAAQIERITAAFPVTHTSTENLKIAVTEFTRVARESPLPERALAHVSRVLESHPQFEIDALNWSVARAGGREAKAGPPPAETIELYGRVNAMRSSDYRGITAQVQRFAGALGGGGYELVRTQLPFDITSEGTLTGDVGRGAETGEAPRFTIVLARRLP
jgi:hypothetical protein